MRKANFGQKYCNIATGTPKSQIETEDSSEGKSSSLLPEEKGHLES